MPQKKNKKTVKQISKKTRAGTINTASTFFEKSEIYLSRNLNIVLWASILITLVCSVLLFDIRFSLAGDDSAYVVRAYDFIHHFIFPGFQGPIYPIVLSPFVAIFGIRAIPLKALSLLFILGFIYVFFRAFRNRIPALLLTFLLALMSVNSFILYYASQTFSEAFFMLLQGLAFCVFFAFFIDYKGPKSLKIQLKEHLLLALCLLGLGLTRSIGFAAIPAIAVYFILKRQWKNLLFCILSFTFILVVYLGFKLIIWGSSGIQFSEQIQALMAKDYYNPALGTENIPGFFQRLFINCNFYLSQAFYAILGVRSIGNTVDMDSLLTGFTVLLTLFALFTVYRKNDYLFFTGIYAFITLLITFLIAHTAWKQSRFIIPYFPLLLMLVLGLFYYLLNSKRRFMLQFLLPAFIMVLFGLSLKVTASRIKSAQQITSEYYGFSPDMENYCRASKWASENLPQNTLVACRKPSVSFIYSYGRKFFGITRLLFYPVEPFLYEWQKGKRPYYLIPMSTVNDKPLTRELFNAFSYGIVGWGMKKDAHLNNAQFLIMNFPDSILGRTLLEMKALNVRYTADPDSLITWLKDSKKRISIIYVDSLVSFLLKSKVTHVLTDNLRANPNRKNNQIMGTVEHFMYFIELKYPAIRTKIMQIGDDNNEPAAVYELNFKLYGLRIPE